MTLIWKGEMAKERAKQAASLGLKLGAEHLLGKANETVPYLDGILEQSGTVDSDELEAAVSYGGAAHAYAIVQHEHVEFNHPGKGRAKWLELALREETEEIQQVIAKAIRKGLGG
jgi:hypothetical protein